MNKVIDVDGYRLFQSSFDPDEQGTVLSVSYDRPGMQLTYTGYFLLFVGFVWTLFSKKSRFGRLRKELGEMKNNAPFCLLFFLILSGISSMQVLSAQQNLFLSAAITHSSATPSCGFSTTLCFFFTCRKVR